MFYFRCGILLNRSVILLRMRKRSNLGPRMEKCAEYLIDDPAALRGKWLESFPGYDRLYLELGCGKRLALERIVYSNVKIRHLSE